LAFGLCSGIGLNRFVRCDCSSTDAPTIHFARDREHYRFRSDWCLRHKFYGVSEDHSHLFTVPEAKWILFRDEPVRGPRSDTRPSAVDTV
jgi:hypothetical protein